MESALSICPKPRIDNADSIFLESALSICPKPRISGIEHQCL